MEQAYIGTFSVNFCVCVHSFKHAHVHHGPGRVFLTKAAASVTVLSFDFYNQMQFFL